MVSVALQYLSLVVREIRARTANVRELTVTETLDVTEAEVVGDRANTVGSYQEPAIDGTVTLSSGERPAGTLPWGGPQQVAVGVTLEDPVDVIDPATDVDVYPTENPDADSELMFEFVWIDDPGEDVDLDVAVSKLI